MYGQIHIIVRKLMMEKFGPDIWQKVLSKSGLEETVHFKVFTSYSDEITFKLIGAVSKILNLSLDIVLEVFGVYFLQYCRMYGYDKMVRALGSNFQDFIQNLDFFHSYLSITFEKIRMPSFRCESLNENEMIIHYYSCREGLTSLVKGILKGVAEELFNTSIKVEVMSNEETNEEDENKQHLKLFYYKLKIYLEHTVKFPEEPKLDAEHLNSNLCKQKKVLKCKLKNYAGAFVDNRTFHQIFPFHIIFDQEMRIHQVGSKLGILKSELADCDNLTKNPLLSTGIVKLINPEMNFTFENSIQHLNSVYILEFHCDQDRYFRIKGGMTLIPQHDDVQGAMLLFIGTPRVKNIDELIETGFFIGDIPNYDSNRELIFLNQQRKVEIGISADLETAMDELRCLHIELETEKRKTELLLSEMLPAKVAQQLKENGSVEAEKFKMVTIIFSDIVQFTNIAAACTPMDIVNMLNELYNLFDLATGRNKMYKVETIGDAYMVAAGIPDPDDEHAKKAANQAIDMVEAACEVKNPVSGEPLKIRVGMHSGPVVAGVVGKRMPRYCLFGDTVNTASRMESNSLACRIHCSKDTYNQLEPLGYKFEDRNEVEIKGKGKMHTYFLIGTPHRELQLSYSLIEPTISKDSRKITSVCGCTIC